MTAVRLQHERYTSLVLRVATSSPSPSGFAARRGLVGCPTRGHATTLPGREPSPRGRLLRAASAPPGCRPGSGMRHCQHLSSPALPPPLTSPPGGRPDGASCSNVAATPWPVAAATWAIGFRASIGTAWMPGCLDFHSISSGLRFSESALGESQQARHELCARRLARHHKFTIRLPQPPTACHHLRSRNVANPLSAVGRPLAVPLAATNCAHCVYTF